MEHSHTKASMPQFKRMFLVPLSRKVPWQQHLNYEIHIICSKRSATVHKAVSHACVRISKWKFSVMFLDVFRDMTLKGKPPPYFFGGGQLKELFDQTWCACSRLTGKSLEPRENVSKVHSALIYRWLWRVFLIISSCVCLQVQTADTV